MKRWLTLLLGTALGIVAAELPASWRFSERIDVSGAPRSGVFHHLDAAGRKSIALAGAWIGVVWEDNSSGRPEVYLAGKRPGDDRFGAPLRISAGGDAYEPVIAALGEGRFLLAWEEQGAVWVRSVDIASGNDPGPPMRLSDAAAGHAGLAVWKGHIYAVWRERKQAYPALQLARLESGTAGELRVVDKFPLEKRPAIAAQLYPAIVAGAAGVLVAWEDRRAGHTRLLISHAADGRMFHEPVALNEFLHDRNAYDKGNGVTRVSLTAFGEDEVLAAWMDKRRGGKGYGIYAAMGSAGGAGFGPNERVQDAHGDELPHYNPAVAGNTDGLFLVAWNDHREGSSDIWLSGYSDEMEWGSDFSPPPASGAGEQSSPGIALDPQGILHLVWVERADLGAPTRIWYASALYRE